MPALSMQSLCEENWFALVLSEKHNLKDRVKSTIVTFKVLIEQASCQVVKNDGLVVETRISDYQPIPVIYEKRGFALPFNF